MRVGKRRRHRWPWVVLGVVAVLALVFGWIGLRAVSAQRHLTSARTGVAELRSALVDGNNAKAKRVLHTVQADTSSARGATSDPVWKVVGALPVVGDSPRAVTQVSAALDDVAVRVLPPLVTSGGEVDPRRLRVSGRAINLAPIRKAAPALTRSAIAAGDVKITVDAVGGHLLPQVRTAVDKVTTQVDELASATSDAAAAARLLPAMLGADGPRTYFLGFLNNAEARPIGGILGAYGILKADRGTLRVVRLGTKRDLKNAKTLPNFGPQYRDLYGDNGRLWVDGSLSPDFATTGKVWSRLWRLQTGQQIDGALATDPVALGYLLEATGGFRLPDGTNVTGANAARLTMQQVYARYPKASAPADLKRDTLLQDVAHGAFTRMLSGRGDPLRLAQALGRAAGEGRLQVWSRRPAEERDLAAVPLGQALPADEAPYLQVAVSNDSGTKLDYYLQRSISWSLGECRDGRRAGRVRLVLRNAAPKEGLPPYVTLRVDERRGFVDKGGPPGQTRYQVYVFLSPRGGVTAATIDGTAFPLGAHQIDGHPVVSFEITLNPGQRRTVILRTSEPTFKLSAHTDVQPVVKHVHNVVDTPDC